MVGRRLGIIVIAVGALGVLLGLDVPGGQGPALMLSGAILIASGVIAIALTDSRRSD
ncbi:MAG: hypothetical protein WD534_14025 [Phycisphaeraceae bacterium]